MKYLFFDCECANCFDKVAKICSIGYTITDINFNIIEKKDLIINPEDIFDYHLFKKDSKINLAYKKSDFYNSPTFKERYNELKKLFEANDTIVFGYSILNDIKFLIDSCDRYKLDYLKFHYVDVQDIYKAYNTLDNKTGLDSALNHLQIIDDSIHHKSDDDAFLTMMVLKAISELNDNSSLINILGKYNLKIKTIDDYINEAKERKRKKEESRLEHLERVAKLKELIPLYDKVLIEAKSQKYSGKCFCFSNQVARFGEKAILAQKIIYDNGGMTTKDYKDGNIVILGHKENEESYKEKNISYIWINEII